MDVKNKKKKHSKALETLFRQHSIIFQLKAIVQATEVVKPE